MFPDRSGRDISFLLNINQKCSCSSVTLRLSGCMFSICSAREGHGYGVQGCIARAWSERRGVSGGLRHQGAVPRGAGPAALAGRLHLPLLRPSGALRAGGSSLRQAAARPPSSWRRRDGSSGGDIGSRPISCCSPSRGMPGTRWRSVCGRASGRTRRAA